MSSIICEQSSRLQIGPYKGCHKHTCQRVRARPNFVLAFRADTVLSSLASVLISRLMLNIRKPDLTPLGRGRSTWTTTTSSGGEVVTSVFPSAGVRWTSRGSDLDMYDRAPIGGPNGTPHFSPHAFYLLTPSQTSNSSAQTCTTSPAKNPTWAPHPAPQVPAPTPTHTLADCTTPPIPYCIPRCILQTAFLWAGME